MATPPHKNTPRVLDRSTTLVTPLLEQGRKAPMPSRLSRLTLGRPWAWPRRRRHCRCVSGSLPGFGASATARRALEQTLFGCRLGQPVGSRPASTRNAVGPPAIWHHIWLSAYAELGTVTWHGPNRETRATPVPAGGGSARL